MRKPLLARKKKEKSDPIRWRGHEVTRIEAFSDAVFAFAVTLMAISLEVPKNAEELFKSMLGFVPFAICFILFFQIWNIQNVFFRRFGLHDEKTIVFNGILIFLVLFFTYPLKFLFGMLFLSQEYKLTSVTDIQFLYLVYGFGFAAIFFCFAFMYNHALHKKEHLTLTDQELFHIQSHIYRMIAMGMMGVLSIPLAFMGAIGISIAWVPYVFTGLAVWIVYSARDKQYQKQFGKTEDTEIEIAKVNAVHQVVTEQSDVPDDDPTMEQTVMD